jgi:hypothetical protein
LTDSPPNILDVEIYICRIINFLIFYLVVCYLKVILRLQMKKTEFITIKNELKMDKINQMRLEFEEKLKKDWDSKWNVVCKYDEGKINRKAKFYEALAADINAATNISVSRDTVQRFNKGEGGDSKASLEAYARYIGYKSWEDFEGLNEKDNENKVKLKWFVGIVIMAIIAASFYVFLLQPYRQKKEILKVIENANRIQFLAFKRLNLKDSVKIDSFYTRSGSARKGIITLIKESQHGNRRINVPIENPSYYIIHEKRVVELKNNQAIVKTKEHWFLKWYDTGVRKYTVSYDQLNEQIYQLKNIDGHWKIENNFFEGKASKIDF